jgi:uncharacterized protein GlcG (DUF336 family)
VQSGVVPWRAVLGAALGIAAYFLLAAPEESLKANGSALTAEDVRRVITQAAASAQALGLPSTIAVTDREGNVLGVFQMEGARRTSRVAVKSGGGLEGREFPAQLLAISKAGTGALLSSGGNAFSTRTASFIVQEHLPPAIQSQPGGPLFGVQFSSLMCSDFKQPGVPLGLAADAGGLPVYKDGQHVGGVGVEGDGEYGFDPDPADFDAPAEEQAAAAGTIGFEAPALLRADNILVDGVRLAFANVVPQAVTNVAPVPGVDLVAPRAAPATSFVPTGLVPGVPGRTDPRFPIRAGAVLTAADVATILTQAANQTAVTRAAIRQPLGSNARVSIAVVDLDGQILGLFQNEDAPNFGLDVSVQKARTASFFSSPTAGAALQAAGLSIYVRDAPLDGSFTYTSRAVGFLAQPFFPPGIEGTDPGPFSVPIGEWSPFNTGLQLDLLTTPFEAIITPGGCVPRVPGLKNGITIFPGGIPLFKGGRLAGAIGISGDGVDQDDLIAGAGTAGFEVPQERRSDSLVVRGVRLPWVKYPRHPNL